MVDFTAWLIVGAITGWMSNSLIGPKERLPLSIIVGLVGALMAGIGLVPLVGIPLNPNNFNLQAMLVSWGGTVSLLIIFSLLLRHEALR